MATKTKTKRTETGALDAAWLKEALKNPNVQISDAESGKKIESEKDLNDLLAEEQAPKTAAEKKADEQQQEAADLANNPPGTTGQEAEQTEKLADAEKSQKQRERDEEKAKQDVARRNKAAMTSTQRLLHKANNATAPILEKAGNAVDVVSAARTPGGIGFLVILLIFLVSVVVIVNQAGDTRIKQLWYMMLGRATLIGRVTPDTGTSSSSTGSGNSSSSAGGNTGNAPTIPGTDIPIIPILPGLGLSYRGQFSGGTI